MRKAQLARGGFAASSRFVRLTFAVVCGVSGCAGGSRGALEPRTRDVEALRRDAVVQPQAPEPLHQLALLAYEERRSEDALRALHGALQRDPDYEPALTLWARLLFESGRSVEGVHWFARRTFDDWPQAVRLNLALLLADVGQEAEARRVLGELMDGAHADAAAANLAWLDLAAGDPGAAAARLESLARRDDAPPQVLNNLAVAYMQSGEVEASARLFERLADEHPDFVPAHANRAVLLRYYLFDDEGAARAEEIATSRVPLHLSDAVVDELLRSEDTSPPEAKEAP